MCDKPHAAEAFSEWLGRTAQRSYVISARMLDEFIALSGDRSPIHVDDRVARDRGLQQRVVHGALQAALVSAVLGMDLPGARGMLQSMELKFRRPCYPGDCVEVTVKVEEAHASVHTVVLSIRMVNQRRELVTSGKAQSLIQEP